MVEFTKIKCMKNIVILTATLVMLALSFSSCEKPDVTKDVTGTIIGTYYYGGNASLLVQIDKKYPIGKTIEYVEAPTICMNLPKDGVYQNMIQVQPSLPLSDWSENAEIINKRISFSYREYQRSEEGENDGDYLLFTVAFVHSNGMCPFPDIPIYVITKCEFLN